MSRRSRRLIVHADAAFEMDAAFRWYESQRRGLGARFMLAVEAAFVVIARQPELFRKVRGPVRRAALRRFEYGVFFVASDETVDVLAIVHGRRSQEHWPSPEGP